MSSTPLSGLGRLGYGAFYTPPVAFMYLFSLNERTALEIPWIWKLNSEVEIVAMLLISLYGAIWIHHVGLLIFGDSGGLQASRLTTVSRRHMIFFSTGVPLQDLPESDSLISLVIAAVTSGEVQLEAFIRSFPVVLYYILTYVVFIWLSINLYEGSAEFVGGILWLILFILLFRDRIVGYLPDHIPRSSIQSIDKAEWVATREQIQEGSEGTNRRIQPRKISGSGPSRRYREELMKGIEDD